MNNKKILILGSSSFAGSSLVNYLLDKNYIIYGTYNSKKPLIYLPYLKNKKIKNYKEFKINFKNKNDYKRVVSLIKKNKFSIIIDFASVCIVPFSWKYPEQYFEINVESKSYLLKKISFFKFIKKYIYISTPEVFGSNKSKISENEKLFNPSTPYATSKLSAEFLFKNYNKNYKFPSIIARFSNFYGPAQPLHRLIPKLIMSIKSKSKFPLEGAGTSQRSYIHVKDFCDGMYKLIKLGKPGQTYHFSDNNIFSVKEIVVKICKLLNVKFSDIVKMKSERLGKDKTYFLNSQKTKKSLSWKCKISIDKGINSVLKYININYKNFLNLPTN
jgi:dTDP-glucose 4,6-dehydratase